MRQQFMPCTIWILTLLALGPRVGVFAHAQVGSIVENRDLPALAGGTQPLLSPNANANVFVFFRPGKENSRLILKELAECEKELAGKSVHWVAIVSDSTPRDVVEADMKASGIAMPVLIDRGDALYGKLGVALHPIAGIADRNGKLAAYQPFQKVNFAVVLLARVRHLLGEISAEELDRALHPGAATMGGNAQVARRNLHLAEALVKTQKLDKALEIVRRSIEKDPTFAAAHTLLGQILAAQGKHAEATQAFEQALRLAPDNAVALEGLKAVKGKK
jgi:tetratricopeptide (TPR) repeat protein